MKRGFPWREVQLFVSEKGDIVDEAGDIVKERDFLIKTKYLPVLKKAFGLAKKTMISRTKSKKPTLAEFMTFILNWYLNECSIQNAINQLSGEDKAKLLDDLEQLPEEYGHGELFVFMCKAYIINQHLE